ncbi:MULTISPECIES: hypothetical protein [Actinomadura]|uniref:SRPBCC family protein n=1 Tax=Actinomadura yumaensis TaxID=111807 RepID=A0ABW2CX59_9ACTN|nr:hypothetical protein [Actinomadura sp. J1-007]MWK36325.1 hypothetical protein [Actinomadura sp. J1-007]
METVVQWVRTSWTKRSRGHPGADRRNAAPTSFRLPSMRAPFVHEVFLNERDDFRPRFEARPGLPDRSTGCGVSLREEDGLLLVELVASPYGMPRRWRRPPVVRVADGEWLRWSINYRFAGTNGGEWSYRLDTFNVAHGTTSADVFLGAPTRHVDELAALR